PACRVPSTMPPTTRCAGLRRNARKTTPRSSRSRALGKPKRANVSLKDTAAPPWARPDDPFVAQAFIDLFTLEKALYEMRYDLRNRPDWVDIPLRGVLALLPDSG